MTRLSLSLMISLCVVSSVQYATAEEDTIRNTVVKIHTTSRAPDFGRPWTKGTPRKSSGTGVVIEGNRILTNAHVISYAQQIFVQADQSTDKIPAQVIAMAPGMDLAILKVDEESFFKDKKPLQISDKLPALKETVNVYGYPMGGEQLSVTEGIISRIDYASMYYGAAGLRIQVDAALNPGNSGGPAIGDGKIVGLVFSGIPSAENIGYLISTEEIRFFLDDVKDGKYDGKPRMFDSLQSTENQALRKKLGMGDDLGGLMVKKPYNIGDDYPLKSWDVITHIGDHPIDKQGSVSVNGSLRLPFKYLIPQVVEGDKLPLTIWRDKKKIEIELPITTKRDYLLPYLNGKYPEHFIFGPLVFTNATRQHLRLMSGARGAYFSRIENPIIARQNDRPAYEGEQLVILSPRMFPHRVVKGYDTQPFAVLTRVNEVEIKNLAHLVETLRAAKGKFLTFSFAGRSEDFVFDRQEILDTVDQILDDEGIRYQMSDSLRPIWNGPFWDGK